MLFIVKVQLIVILKTAEQARYVTIPSGMDILKCTLQICMYNAMDKASISE